MTLSLGEAIRDRRGEHVTLNSVFDLRDLSYCFWDPHLWLRRSLV
jgi:hypothetical protein